MRQSGGGFRPEDGNGQRVDEDRRVIDKLVRRAALGDALRRCAGAAFSHAGR